MTPEQEAVMRGQHQPATYTSNPPQRGCTSCGVRYGWPCQTASAFTLVDEAREALARCDCDGCADDHGKDDARYADRDRDDAMAARNLAIEALLAARADADRLAGALRDLTHGDRCDHRWCEVGREALAAHDALGDRP